MGQEIDERRALGPYDAVCDRCGAAGAREHGNGMANWCEACKALPVVAEEENGSRTERTTREALAELGARALIAMRERDPAILASRCNLEVLTEGAEGYSAIRDAAIALGLLEPR